MNNELIQATEYGAEFERTWTETNLLLPQGIVMSAMECRCPCTSTCPKAGNDIVIVFSGF